MDQTSSQSSTTILLVISVLVLATIGAGWFLLDSEPATTTLRTAPMPASVPTEAPPAAPQPTANAPAAVEDEVAEQGVEPEAAAGSTPAITVSDVPPAAVQEADAAPDLQSAVESDLRKARMAAEAEIFVEPLTQSALYFYGRVLEAAPGHEVANAELDAVLGQLSVTASGWLSSQQYREAFDLSMHVARVRPDHALVNDVQQTIDQLSGELVTQAMRAAESGDEEQATALLESAQSLPGRNARYFQAVRESMADLLTAQATAEAERIENAQASAARETRSWMEKVRGAIADGRLVAPADDCALQYVKERGSDDDIAKQLEKELLAAVVTDASARIDAGQLDSAEPLIEAARSINGSTDEIEGLRASLEAAYRTRESARVLPTTEFVRRNSVAPRYPRRAQERGISGWVEVLFTVTPTGETAEISVAESEPGRIFDETAVEAVQQWLFEPREFRGRPIAQKSRARLVFTLD